MKRPRNENMIVLSIEQVKKLRAAAKLGRVSKWCVVPIRCPRCWRNALLLAWGWINPYVYHTMHFCDNCAMNRSVPVSIDIYWLIKRDRVAVVKARICEKEEEWRCSEIDEETLRKMIYGKTLLEYGKQLQ